VDANPSSGHTDEESYNLFVSKYEEFVKEYRVDSLKRKSSASHLGARSPLQLALMISPLYLFMTWRLSLKSFQRGFLIDLAARLGPHKHPLLLSVEKLIWDAVFKLADGAPSVYDVLKDLTLSLPWNEINDELNFGTEKWFAPVPCMLPLF
jgi:hypothetical protein